jgi:hypothetical protein
MPDEFSHKLERWILKLRPAICLAGTQISLIDYKQQIKKPPEAGGFSYSIVQHLSL